LLQNKINLNFAFVAFWFACFLHAVIESLKLFIIKHISWNHQNAAATFMQFSFVVCDIF